MKEVGYTEGAKDPQESPEQSELELKPSHTPTFFRKCPNCGKRFELERIGETVERKEEVVPSEKTLMPVASIAASYPMPVADPSAMTKRIKIDEVVEDEVHTRTMTCKHCGHTWKERFEEVKHVGEVEGAQP